MDYQNNIFCTPIWGLVLNNLNHYTKKYIDFVLELEASLPSTKQSNLSGYQSKNSLHKESTFSELVELLNIVGNDIGSNLLFPTLKINSLWANVNRFKDCNVTHIHEGVISGVLYLSVPEESGRLVLCNPAVRADNSLFAGKEYYIEPTRLSCIMFPSWLEHYVEPNMNTTEPRISLSFNFMVDQ